MTDIFVSYAREDRDTVSTLAAHLEATGWTVWWDRQILAGKEFDTVIETEIGQARCVLVVWSAHSVDSRWVKTEASEGLRRDILVPIIVDGCTPPLAFRNIQSVSFPHAVIEPGSAAFDDLIASITPLVKPRAVREPAVAVATEPSHAAAAVLVHESHAIGQAPVYTAPAESTRGDASRRPWYRRWPVVVGVALAVILFGTYRLYLSSGTNRRGSETVQGERSPLARAKPREVPPSASDSHPVPIPGFAGASSDALTHPRLQVFVESFLAAMASGEVERIMPFYGDRVDYYAKGPVGQDYIRQDKLAYFRRWPIVRQSLLGEIAVRDIAAPNEKAVTFRSAYEVYSPERKAHARGTSQSALVVAAVDGMLKIVDHKETVKSAGQ